MKCCSLKWSSLFQNAEISAKYFQSQDTQELIKCTAPSMVIIKLKQNLIKRISYSQLRREQETLTSQDYWTHQMTSSTISSVMIINPKTSYGGSFIPRSRGRHDLPTFQQSTHQREGPRETSTPHLSKIRSTSRQGKVSYPANDQKCWWVCSFRWSQGN